MPDRQLVPPQPIRRARRQLVDQLVPSTPGDMVQRVASIGAHTSQRHRALVTLSDGGGQQLGAQAVGHAASSSWLSSVRILGRSAFQVSPAGRPGEPRILNTPGRGSAPPAGSKLNIRPKTRMVGA